MQNSVLIVDDEPGIRDSLCAVLEDEGFEVETAATGEACIKLTRQNHFTCILLDVWLGKGIDGLTTLKKLREDGSDAAVVMISGHGNIETAVRSTKLGAFDFVEKPLSLEKTVVTVKNAVRQRQLEITNAELQRELAEEYVMVGESVAMRALRKQIAIVAPSDGIWNRKRIGCQSDSQPVKKKGRGVCRDKFRGYSGRACGIGAIRSCKRRIFRCYQV